MRRDDRIRAIQLRHKAASEEYNNVKQSRMELVRTLYREGWTIEELLESLTTHKAYLMRCIPEAFAGESLSDSERGIG